MRKAERLFQLLTLLRGRRTALTASALAEVLEVSERTIYRDIQALSLSGVPIEGEAGVGYRLRPEFNLPPLMFDEEELEALLLGVRLVQGCSDQHLGQSASRVLDKVRAVLPTELYDQYIEGPEWFVVPGLHRQWTTQYSDQIRVAIKNRFVIAIGYQREDKQQSEREVWPLGLVYWGAVWTLVAWCELRDDFRMFRLDRIQSLTQLSRHFETTDQISLQTYLKRTECTEA
ncbi:helix-turn-helix transcriptional regulator [Neptuniibacter sp. QD48_11]|uniref:helix-turn-helix transcriptional regulator n=1 Tax=unclassified Neptuniibacter TaxID=2630693 RepID=UPI0039F4C781